MSSGESLYVEYASHTRKYRGSDLYCLSFLKCSVHRSMSWAMPLSVLCPCGKVSSVHLIYRSQTSRGSSRSEELAMSVSNWARWAACWERGSLPVVVVEEGENALARARAERPRGVGAMFSLDCSIVSKSTRRGGGSIVDCHVRPLSFRRGWMVDGDRTRGIYQINSPGCHGNHKIYGATVSPR